MAKDYCGVLDVDEDAFVLKADRLLVVAGERVAFEFSGEDEGGPFRVLGTASIADGGFYVAADVEVVSTRGGRATIRFFRAECTDSECVVEGSWSQDGYTDSPWGFSAELDPLG